MKLLNSGNAKTRKGEKQGFITYGIHLAPAHLSGYNACFWASQGCTMACLNTAGRGAMNNVQKARINKTRYFFEKQKEFMHQLEKEIGSAIKSAGRKGMQPCFRLNLTSDLAWEGYKKDGLSIIERFPQVQFYDYTKGFRRMQKYLSGKMPSNYHLTFSRSESNGSQANLIAKMEGNVAVVFRGRLPRTFYGLPVVDGDETDLRFLDKRGCVVGLVEKGMAKKDETGFVVEPK